jgi:hypothetical protein
VQQAERGSRVATDELVQARAELEKERASLSKAMAKAAAKAEAAADKTA